MYARLKHLVISSALVGATLTGTSFALGGATLTGTPFAVGASSGGVSGHAAGLVDGARTCSKGQVDACKPGGCCIVD